MLAGILNYTDASGAGFHYSTLSLCWVARCLLTRSQFVVGRIWREDLHRIHITGEMSNSEGWYCPVRSVSPFLSYKLHPDSLTLKGSSGNGLLYSLDNLVLVYVNLFQVVDRIT